MRVAFINPMFGKDFTKSARWFARSRGRVQRHPDYLCTVAAVLEAAGHHVFLLDAQAKNMPTTIAMSHAREFAPEMVVCLASTPSIDSDIAAAAAFKKATGAKTILVGPHVTAEPEDTLRRAGSDIHALDAVAVGEYDLTLRDLADGAPFRDCPGVAWREGAEINVNERRPLIEDLDSLPFPAWSHIDIADYRDAGKLFPFLTLISGRGCSGRCTFCQLPQTMNGRRYRARSVESVMDEIEYDLRLFPNLKEIMFEDDTFVTRANAGRLAELCEELARRDLPVSWSANARVDLKDPELLRLIKRSGCRMLCAGFEFGDQNVLDAVKKGVTLDDMREFAENTHRAGIRVHGCFMFGGPGETAETARKTIDLACSLKIDTAQFSGLVAYPGTTYYEWAKANQFLIPSDWRGWVDDDFEQCATVRCPELTTEQINELIDEGLRKFYLRPRQFWRMAANIRSLSDLKGKLHGLKSFFAYFSSRG